MQLNYFVGEVPNLSFRSGSLLPPFISNGGNTLLPNVGLITVNRRTGLRPDLVEAIRSGPWSIGMLPAGPHGTCLHLRFGTAGSDHGANVALSTEFLLGLAMPIGLNADLNEVLAKDLPLTFAMSDEYTIIQAVRRTVLAGKELAFLREEFERQRSAAARWSRQTQVRDFQRVLRHSGRLLPRRACRIWLDIDRAVSGGEG